MLCVGAAYAQEADRSITVVLQKEPDSLDPCEITKSDVGYVNRNNIIETVTAIDPATGEIIPKIATEWQAVDDDTWRFTLRQGVTFHDGTELTAENFIQSLQRTLNRNLNCSSRVFYFDSVDLEFDAVDDHTVDITSNPPLPLLPTMLIMMPVNAPSTPDDTFTREPIGTGPYKFVDWQSGRQITLERNEDYWGDAPEATGVTYLFRNESLVRAAMVASGEADITDVIASQDADRPDMDISFRNSETIRLRFDLEKPPLDDLRVRKAINMAIDREGLIGTIFSPRWEIATNFVIPPTKGYNEAIESYPYDPDQAAALIEEAAADGVPVDKEILFVARNTLSGANEGTAAMVQMLNAVGLNVRLQMLEVQEFFEFYFKPFDPSQPVHFLMESHDNNSGDAGFTLLGKYHSKGGVSKLNDPTIDALIEKGAAAQNPEREAIFKEVFQRVHDDAVDAMLFHEVVDSRVGARIAYNPKAATKGMLNIAEITFK
ncbi:ABC transporter substrate-binding protein [Marinivivus vitaminiproducens]|uniref:ABC transporter substrate-binding protein n=1 Tax=Marinivivus vitaminiproducens TaxID=3035935 RepID=UPI0027A63B8B|nr:ABC transporter substrate-binding protein [Geminicoccaceae bacterium SCSIO 64248]